MLPPWRLAFAVSSSWPLFEKNELAYGGGRLAAVSPMQAGFPWPSALYSHSLQQMDFKMVGKFTSSSTGAVLCFVVWHSVGWMQRSTQRLARPHAVFIGLLTPILILPYSILIGLLA